jgi:uncharacterized membrane protein (Fun14 family)
MNEQTTEYRPPSRNVARRFAGDVFALPRWQKVVLIVAGIAGGFGWVVRSERPTAATPARLATTERAEKAGGSGFVSTSEGPIETQAPEAAPTAQPSQVAGSWAKRIGLSVVLGFVVGWITRAFMKMAAALALSFASVMALLSYFHILNVDMTTAVDKDYHDASAWVSDQAGKLKDAAMAHLPSGTAGLLGVYMGVRRRK